MNGDSIRQTLAQNIKRFRETRNKSQADLAFDAGISIPFLSDIERGNKWPSPETIAKARYRIISAFFTKFAN